MASQIASRTTVNTSPSTITLDFNQMESKTFVGNTAFTGSKTIAFKNDTYADSFMLDLPVTTSCALTFPSSCVAATTESRWNNGSKVLTLTGSGTYTIVGVFNGTTWKLKASADGEFA